MFQFVCTALPDGCVIRLPGAQSLTLDHPNERRHRAKVVLGSACAVVFCVLVFAALWPFTPFPPNQVSWLTTEHGLRFGRDGIVYSSRGFDPNPSSGNELCSLELLIEPANFYVANSETILGFYAPDSPTRFRLIQRHDELFVQQDFKDQRNRLYTEEIEAAHVFLDRTRSLFTITSTGEGTIVYRDGQFIESNSRFGMNCESVSGQLILGNSPTAYDPWQGDILGMAFYRGGLNKDQVRSHFESWNQAAIPAGLERDGLVSLYTFSEGRGATVHDGTTQRVDLTIPSTFDTPHKPFLAPPWQEYSPDLDYLWDVVINIAGFVPFGFFLCAYFFCDSSWRSAAIRAFALGGLLSLSFEVSQGMLPSRSSGMTDIITNTMGTGIGVLLCKGSWVRNLFAKYGSAQI